MKIAICDDDRQELSHILSLLDSYQAQQHVTFTICPFHDSRKLADTLSETQYDLYLLDIIMPEITGMELAKEIRSFDKAADIIFLTTSPEYAVESYTVKATNYLMKPIVPDRFYQSLDEIRKKRDQEQGRSLVLKSNIGVHKILLNQLMYVEAQGRKVLYYLANGEEIVCTDRFSPVCDQLLQYPEFILVHRSFLVNMNYIRRIDGKDFLLTNGIRIPIRTNGRAEVVQRYNRFLVTAMRGYCL